MPVRGLSEVEVATIGGVSLTAAEGAYPAGDPLGRPLNGSLATVDGYDPNPGVTAIGATGRLVTTFFPLEQEGALWPLEVRLTRYDPVALLPALQAVFATGAAFDVSFPLVDGRTFTGSAKADRTGGQSPIQTTNDHPHYGGQGRELVLKMLAVSGGFA